MVAIKAFSVLALTAATIAVPVAQPQQVGDALVRRDAEPQPWGGSRANYSWRYGWGRPQGQGESQPAAETPAETPAQPQATAAAAPQSAPASDSSDNSSSDNSAPAAAAPAASSGGSSGGYMGIVQQWRSNMGLPALTEDSKLQSNAQDTSISSGGQLVHKLNSGSMAQVMAPGNSGNFESVFVGGWLCELPNLPGLGAATCNSASQGWNHAGQTGHAEILSSTKYTKIGCSNESNMWTCDLA